MKEGNKTLISTLLLVIATAIWGFAFVAQSEAMNHIGPYTMNGFRALLAAVFLVPAAAVNDKIKGKHITLFGTDDKQKKKDLLLGGLLCGVFVTLASTVQQIGIQYTSVGKAGFLTSSYIVFVPIFSLLLGKKINWNGWLGVGLALVGMFLLCSKDFGAMEVNVGDIMMIASALFFSIHILVIDKFASRTDPIRMSCIQFAVCAVVCITLAFIFETPRTEDILNAWFSVFFAGVLSAGVGYTLQIVAQKHIPSHVTPLIMSLESVFSLIAGAIVLHEHMNWQESIGCVIIFAAILLAQIDFKKFAIYFKKK